MNKYCNHNSVQLVVRKHEQDFLQEYIDKSSCSLLSYITFYINCFIVICIDNEIAMPPDVNIPVPAWLGSFNLPQRQVLSDTLHAEVGCRGLSRPELACVAFMCCHVNNKTQHWVACSPTQTESPLIFCINIECKDLKAPHQVG